MKDKKSINTYWKNKPKENKLLINKQEMPPVSSFNELEIDNNLLVKGEGPIYGTIACFQMLSNLLAFPFRRDSIEKVLKEFFEENNFVSLQLCAKIASYYALQVSVSKLNSNFITGLFMADHVVVFS